MSGFENSEILYIGFLLPSLFAISLVVEGIYKVVKKEDGVMPLIMGIFFLLGLGLAFVFINAQ